MKKLLLLLPIALFMYAKPTLDADYDRGEELILMERMPLELEDLRTGEFIFPNTIPLGSIYWNSNTSQYYYAKDGTRLTKTNGLTYKLDPKKEQEPSFIGEPQDLELVYAGYIETNMRLYINQKTKEQYVKILEPIFDDFKLTPKLHEYEEGIPLSVSYWKGISYGTCRNPANGKWDIESTFPQD